MSGRLIEKEIDENWVLSLDGSLIYVAGNDGQLKIYDATDGTLIQSINLGVDLDAIDLSADGTHLVVTEAVGRNAFDSPNGSSFDTLDIDLYVVSTATLSFQVHTYQTDDLESSFADATFTDNSTVILSQFGNFAQPLVTFDLETSQFTASTAEYESGFNHAQTLSSSTDDDQFLITSRSTELMILDANLDLQASSGPLPNPLGIGITSQTFAVDAFWGTGPSGLVAVGTSFYLHLLDGDLTYIATLPLGAVDPFQVRALTFSDDGSTLFAITAASDQIYAFDTDNPHSFTLYDLPTMTVAALRWGEELVFSDTDGVFYINGTDGIYSVTTGFVDIGLIPGTEGADQLQGTADNDTIEAYGGNDTIIGSPGTDIVDGGADIDTLRMWMESNSYFPAFSGEESFVLTADRFYDAAGRVDTTFTNIEIFNFSSGNRDLVNFDGSAFVPVPSSAPYATILTFTGNSNVLATEYNDFVIASGTDSFIDGGGGIDRLQVFGGSASDDAIFVTTVGDAIFFSQMLWDMPSLAVTATNFESVIIPGNASIFVSRTIDASQSPIGIDFFDGVSDDTITGSVFDDVFNSVPTNVYRDRDGTDVYTGNGGADRYVFGREMFRFDDTTITDFASDDIIDLTPAAGALLAATQFIGTSAFNAVAGEYRYEKSDGQTFLQFDGDGDGITDGTLTLASGEFDFVAVAGTPTSQLLTVTNVISGTFGIDGLLGSDVSEQIFGLAGSDTLTGLAGNDILDGGTGNDTMIGGLGDDTYYLDNVRDVAVELSGEGYDRANVAFNLITSFATWRHFEAFELTGSAFKLSGNSLDNELVGNASRASILRGLGGDDRMEGGSGNDLFYGGPGVDILIGNAGRDRLDGGTSGDDMRGGAGNDYYIVDNAGDTITELANEGTDLVVSSLNWTLGDNVEDLRLRSAGTIGTGNALANTIYGNSVASTLYGMDGNDKLFGNIGADVLFGGEGDDNIYGKGGADLIEGGGGADRLRGGDGEDVLDGGDGADFIRGEKGNDTILGGAGGDSLFGDAGEDIITGGADRDVMSGGAGADTFIFADGDFAGLTIPSADRITDFSVTDGDIIDLSAVDAILGAGDDAFAFVGDAAFSSTAGELRWENVGSNTMIYMDVDGDGAADYAIRLDGTMNLSEADFVL